MGWNMKRALSARSAIGSLCAAMFLLFGCALEPSDESDDYAQISQELNTPIQIKTLAQLRNMSGSNSYLLMNNITVASSEALFVPIGTSAAPFTGSFDGQGKTITNLRLAGNRTYAGMFGYTNGASIYNVKLTNVQLTNNMSYTGAIVGFMNSSTVSGCEASGTISGAGYTGGLVGRAANSYLISGKASNLNVSGTTYVGGIAGYAISTSVYSGTSTGGSVTGNTYVGGLAGIGSGSSFAYSTATNLNVQGTSHTGGLVGYLDNGTLFAASATGSIQGGTKTGGLVGFYSSGILTGGSAFVTVTGTDHTGGLVGHASNTSVLQSNVSGTITGTTYTGGIIGRLTGSSTTPALLEDSYIDRTPSNAQTVVTGGTPVGMAIGLAESYVELHRNSAIGKVTGSSKKIGGFVGEINPATGPFALLYETFTNVQVDPIFDGGSDAVYAGGLAGRVRLVRIKDANVAGSVKGRVYVGGALGYVENSSIGSIVQGVLVRGEVTNVATPNRSGLFGGADVSFQICKRAYFDTTTDSGTAPPMPPLENTCQIGLSAVQLQSPDGIAVDLNGNHVTSTTPPDQINMWLPHGDYRIFTYGTYIDAAYEAAWGDRLYCEHGSGSDGNFGFGFCTGVGDDAVIWLLNSNNEYNTLVNIPNPSRQPKATATPGM